MNDLSKTSNITDLAHLDIANLNYLNTFHIKGIIDLSNIFWGVQHHIILKSQWQSQYF